MTMEKFLKTTAWLYDRNYARSFMAPMELIYDDAAEDYVRTRGISAQEMDDTLNWMAINNRRNAAKNPLALDAKSLPRSPRKKALTMLWLICAPPYNPKMGRFPPYGRC